MEGFSTFPVNSSMFYLRAHVPVLSFWLVRPWARFAVTVLKLTSFGSWRPEHDVSCIQGQRAADLKRRQNDPGPEQPPELHSVMFNSQTPAGLASLCVNAEPPHAQMLLQSVPLEVRLSGIMKAGDPWFRQKEIYRSVGLAGRDRSFTRGRLRERLFSYMTDDRSRLLMLGLWLTSSTAH